MFEKSQIIAHAVRAELPEEFCRELSDYLDFVYANPDVYTAMAEYYEKLFGEGGDIFPIPRAAELPLPQKSEERSRGLFEAVVYLQAADHFADFVRRNSLKEEFTDTYYKNLRRIMEMNHVRDNTYGLIRHGYFLYGYAKPYILRIGRLAYELREFSSDPWQICENDAGERLFVRHGEEIPFGYRECIRDGEKYVTIHIPGEGRLPEEEVRASLAEAGPILRKHFAKYAPRHIMCTSWLISPQLKTMLRPEANMIRFQNMFDAVLGHPAENALYELIFKSPVCPLEQLKPVNDFQRKVLELYKAGGKLHNGIGIMKKEFNTL